MEKPKDYYQLLGVPRDASLTAIKRAFRRLARRYRPRRAGATVAALAELQAAYETLSDVERRRRYDDQLQGFRPAPAAGAQPRRPAAGDLRRPLAPASLAAEVVLSLADAAKGTVLSLDVPVSAVCEACDGTGGSFFDCEQCGGEGQVDRRLPVPVHVPPGTREGTVFQIRTDEAAVPSILLTVHLQRPF